MKTLTAPVEILMAVLVMLGTSLKPARAGINEWTSLGPYGGPIKALVIDPQNTRTMYAAAYDRVFKTVDGAASWMPASVGLTNYPIFSGLAIDPQNTSTLYAWGANFAGLFKSADGAASWNTVTLPDRFAVSAVAIAPGTVTYVSGTILAGENYGPPQYSIILKSLDGGASWSTLMFPEHFFGQKLAIDPHSPNTIYVAGYVYAGDPAGAYSAVLKTTDAGANWVEGARLDQHFPILHLILDPGTPDTLYAGTWGVGIYKSSDGGASWSATNSGFPDDFRNTLALTIDPGAPGTLYTVMGIANSSLKLPQGACCAFPGSIFKSTNAGASWREVNSGAGGDAEPRPQRRRGRAAREAVDRLAFDTNGDGDFGPLPVGLAVDPASPGTVYVGTNGDGVFKSTDGGKNWSTANTGLTAMVMSTVAVDPQHASTIYATSWNRLFKSEDGGVTWHAGSWGALALFTSAFAIDPRNPSTIYAGAPGTEFWDGDLFKSTDGGINWSATNLLETVRSRLGHSCGGVETLMFDPQNANEVYVGTTWCGLNRTEDQGGTWNGLDTLPGGRADAVVVDPLNSNTLYATGFVTGVPFNGPNQVYKSLDGGLNWTLANSGLTGAGDVSALLIDSKTPTTLYAGAANQSGYALYKSTDGAASWKRIGPGYLLAIDPRNPRILYAAMAGGVFRSTDGGGSWSLAGAIAGKLAFDPVDSNTLYAATSTGVFAITFAP